MADPPLLARALAAAPPGRGAWPRCFSTERDTPGAECWQDARARAPHPGERPIARDDPALLLFTAGTTGPPKGVVHTHGRCVANLEALRRAWDWTAADVLYLPVVLWHAHGIQNGVHGTLATGCTTVLPDARPAGAAMLATLASERCSLCFGVPTHYERLIAAADAEPELARAAVEAARLFVSGSAPLPPETFRRFQERFGHAPCERYGMTETLMIASNPLDGERLPGSVGFPLAGTAVRVVDPIGGTPCEPGDPGEVWVRGIAVFQGYHARPGFTHPADAAAFSDGWFRTGDLGMWGADGRLRLLGRRDDCILTGGLNVSPDEVEQALAMHPDVATAGVAGVPDDELGQCVAAAVVPLPGAEPPPAALAAHVGARLAGHKKPRRLRIVDALPLTPVGKLDRRALRALLVDAPRVDGRPESAVIPKAR